MTIHVYMIQGRVDWVSVHDRNGCSVADFSSQAAAERYVRRLGHFPDVRIEHVG